MYACSDQRTVIRITGYIGEEIALDYLRNLGFNACSLGDSGCGRRVGDILVARTWFHDNGYCRGHNQTFGIEVKTTFGQKFYRHLSSRQKRFRGSIHWKLPLILIRLRSISKSSIKYDLKEDPESWASSKRLEFWRGSPHYYKRKAPWKCYKEHTYSVANQLSFEKLVEYRRYKYQRSIMYLRRNLRNLHHFNVYPSIHSNQAKLEEFEKL